MFGAGAKGRAARCGTGPDRRKGTYVMSGLDAQLTQMINLAAGHHPQFDPMMIRVLCRPGTGFDRPVTGIL